MTVYDMQYLPYNSACYVSHSNYPSAAIILIYTLEVLFVYFTYTAVFTSIQEQL